MFEPQVARFCVHWRCITGDQRGQGRRAGDSIAAFSDYGMANGLAALMKPLAIEHALFAGMSRRGYVALRRALTHPRLVRGFVLYNTQTLPRDNAAIPSQKKMLAIWSQGGLSQRVAHNIAHIMLGDSTPQAQAWKAMWNLWKPHNLMASFQARMERDDIPGCLGTIQVPALVITRDAHTATPVKRCLAMQRHRAVRAWASLREQTCK